MSTAESSDDKKCHLPSCEKREGEDGVALNKCNQCKLVSYCSRECQRDDWKAHKGVCTPPVSLVESFWEFVEQAKKDHGLTALEYQKMHLTVNRMAGTLNSTNDTVGLSDNAATNLTRAVLVVLDRRLLQEGRGIRLTKLSVKRKKYEGAIAYVVNAIGEKTGPSRRYKVELADGSCRLVLSIDQMRIIPLK
jgi:hypothetical protein